MACVYGWAIELRSAEEDDLAAIREEAMRS